MTRFITHIFWRTLRRGLDAIARDKRGGVAVFLATAIVPLVGFLGLAVDTTRGYLVKSRLSQALDAAGLAGGRVIFSASRDADIQMYFSANFPANYMGATITGPFLVPAGTNNEKLTLTASAVIGTTFLRVLGIETMTVNSEVEVTREQQLLDVVLAIDVSGSMGSSAGGGQTRIQAARSAANTLVGILFGDAASSTLLNIGLVPWNSKVNVTRNGTTFNSALTTFQTVPTFKNPLTGVSQTRLYYANNSPVPLLSAPPSGWRGCVYDRYKNDANTTNDGDIVEAALLDPTGDWMGWEPIGAEGEPTSSGSTRCSSAPSGQECSACFTRGITSLQNTKTGITNAINQLTTPDGNTNVPAGLAWAWRVLTPAAPWTEANPTPPSPRQQAIVLLTDGENVGGYGDGYKAMFGINSAAQASMDARTRLLAANIKAAGITLYVIQFANNNSSMQTLLKQVATTPDRPFYNYAPDAAALQTVFREVANNLSELRLSK